MKNRHVFLNVETAVWLLLVVLLLLSWIIGANRGAGSTYARVGTVALLGLAFFKAWLIIRYFMEVRNAPRALAWVCNAWVVFSCGLITALCLGLF